MSINLDNVKAIVHNNKNVKKIENSHGIIWQKTTPPVVTENYYYINGTTCYKLDFTNKTLTPYTRSGVTSGNGGQIIGFNNKLYLFNNNTAKVAITFDDTNHIITGTNEGTITYAVNGNNIYKLPDWNYFIQANNTSGTDPITPVKVNSDWTAGTEAQQYPRGNCTFIYNGVLYGSVSTNTGGRDLYKWDTTTNTWVTQSDIVTQAGYTYNIWVYGNRLLYDAGADHKEYNFNTKTWDIHIWTGAISFNGAGVFMADGQVYILGGTSTSRNVYKVTGNKIELYWSWTSSQGSAMRGDYIVNSKGSAQLAQTARPRLA